MAEEFYKKVECEKCRTSGIVEGENWRDDTCSDCYGDGYVFRPLGRRELVMIGREKVFTEASGCCYLGCYDLETHRAVWNTIETGQC